MLNLDIATQLLFCRGMPEVRRNGTKSAPLCTVDDLAYEKELDSVAEILLSVIFSASVHVT